MKKSEIAMIILVASLSVMVAFMVANSLPFLKIDEKGVQVDTIDAIKSDVSPPDSAVFNSEAINPTIKTIIGGSSDE